MWPRPIADWRGRGRGITSSRTSDLFASLTAMLANTCPQASLSLLLVGLQQDMSHSPSWHGTPEYVAPVLLCNRIPRHIAKVPGEEERWGRSKGRGGGRSKGDKGRGGGRSKGDKGRGGGRSKGDKGRGGGRSKGDKGRGGGRSKGDKGRGGGRSKGDKGRGGGRSKGDKGRGGGRSIRGYEEGWG